MPDRPPHSHVSAPRIFTPEYYARMRDLEDASWWNAGMRDVAARLLAAASLSSAGTMVDVGCGSGQTITWFGLMYPGWRTIGLDVAPDGLAAGRARGTRRLLCGSALEIPLPSSIADLVVSLDVLQHLPLGGGDRRALAEMHRVLKPDGHLFVRTNAQAFPRTPDDPVFQFHKYDPGELRSVLDAAGFEVVRLGRVNALLGLAEIPRELRARRDEHAYHGLLSQPRTDATIVGRMKRGWLRVEGGLLARGYTLPLGRTLMALCRRA
jgi:SAM-dependent methyltransferase